MFATHSEETAELTASREILLSSFLHVCGGLKRKGRENRLDFLQRFWEKLNEFNESIREERRSFICGKIALFYWLRTVVYDQCFCKTGWNCFHMDVRAEESEFVIHSNNGAMSEFDQNEDIISV